MADGSSKPIEAIQPGDMVLAASDQDPEGPVEPKPVLEVYHNRPDRLLRLQIGDKVIRATINHPFYARHRGWTAARNLKVGDELRTHSNHWVGLSERQDQGDFEAVYNLRVAGHRTYFVGSPGSDLFLLAHNQSGYTHGYFRGTPYQSDFILYEAIKDPRTGRPIKTVPFENGHPVFDRWSLGDVTIAVTGDPTTDQRMAKEAYEAKYGVSIPDDYAFHHDGRWQRIIRFKEGKRVLKCRMQAVPSKLNTPNVPHYRLAGSGPASQARRLMQEQQLPLAKVRGLAQRHNAAIIKGFGVRGVARATGILGVVADGMEIGKMALGVGEDPFVGAKQVAGMPGYYFHESPGVFVDENGHRFVVFEGGTLFTRYYGKVDAELWRKVQNSNADWARFGISVEEYNSLSARLAMIFSEFPLRQVIGRTVSAAGLAGLGVGVGLASSR